MNFTYDHPSNDSLKCNVFLQTFGNYVYFSSKKRNAKIFTLYYIYLQERLFELFHEGQRIIFNFRYFNSFKNNAYQTRFVTIKIILQ